MPDPNNSAAQQPTANSGDISAVQAKANADAAFAVGALCGALGGVGRLRLGEAVQRRFEEVIAEQEATDDND